MKVVQIYVTKDGKKWDTAEEAHRHEQYLTAAESLLTLGFTTDTIEKIIANPSIILDALKTAHAKKKSRRVKVSWGGEMEKNLNPL